MSIATALAVEVPTSIVLRARSRLEAQQRARHRSRDRFVWAAETGRVVARAVVADLEAGRLALASSVKAPLQLTCGDQPYQPWPGEGVPTAKILFDYQPSLAGRLKSRLARTVDEDPAFMTYLQKAVSRELASHGYGVRFCVHLVQRFVEGPLGYHETDRVQVIASVWRRT